MEASVFTRLTIKELLSGALRNDSNQISSFDNRRWALDDRHGDRRRRCLRPGADPRGEGRDCTNAQTPLLGLMMRLTEASGGLPAFLMLQRA